MVRIIQNWFILTKSIISYTPGMLFRRPHSLRKLLLVHEIAFFFLVAVTGLMGGMSAYFWKYYSNESERINQLALGAEQVRSELFRQIQEVIRGRLLEDSRARELYSEYSKSIGRLFNSMRRNSALHVEDEVVNDLQVSYRELQSDMNKIFTNPYLASIQGRMNILDPRFAQAMVGNFDNNYQSLKNLLAVEHDSLDLLLKRWTDYAPVIITITLLLALVLVIYARYILKREFIQPMSAVTDGARIISHGRLDHKIDAEGVEEVTALAQTINRMARDLEDSRVALIETEKQAALGALIPVVAHNIRNPLASIRATAQVLEDVDNVQELRESRQAILDTIDRLGRWVNALVSYLHPLKPNYRLVHASKMIDAALSLLKTKCEEKELRITRIGWENDLRLNVDPDLMEQALYALLANAMDASPPGGEINIQLMRDEGNLVMSIRDEGSGLPFDPKPNNLSPGPSSKRFGTGLGIPIAFKICQQHGWKLTFTTGSGTGTTAMIAAPIRVIEEDNA
jgi:signal transduction histidine kinase